MSYKLFGDMTACPTLLGDISYVSSNSLLGDTTCLTNW